MSERVVRAPPWVVAAAALELLALADGLTLRGASRRQAPVPPTKRLDR